MSYIVTTSYEFPARVSYFKGITGKVFKDESTGEEQKTWSTMLLIPKEDEVTVNAIKAAISSAAKDKWGDKPPKGLKITFRDGDKDGRGGVPDNVEAGDEPYGGHYFLNVKADRRPRVYNTKAECVSHDNEGNAMGVDPGLIVSGDYVVAEINCYAWGPGKFGSGVSWGLKKIQQYKKGEPLGGGDDTKSSFRPITVPESAGEEADVLGIMD